MKTDQLIQALATDVEPVDPRAGPRRVRWGALLGALLAVPSMVWLLGVNPGLVEDAGQPMFWVKFAFVATIAAAALVLLLQLARPAARARVPAVAAVVPVAVMWLLAAITLLAAAPGEYVGLLLGSSWRECPIYIAMLSLPTLSLTLWAVRHLAPTRPGLAGAAAGLLAGALGALVYLLHCPELEAPFLAIWYPLGMLLPTAIGAAVGGRVLAW